MTTEEFYQTYSTNQNGFLYHHGILGQKWGVRRYQNKDGSLTMAGRLRYLSPSGKLTKAGMNWAYGKDSVEEKKKNKYHVLYLTPEAKAYVSTFDKKYLSEEVQTDSGLMVSMYNDAGVKLAKKKMRGNVLDRTIDRLYGKPSYNPDGPTLSYRGDNYDLKKNMKGVSKDGRIIKKGTVLKRVAGDEPISDTRKYVAITPRDTNYYKTHATQLPVDLSKPIYQYEYKARKNLKVASGKDVADYLIGQSPKGIQNISKVYDYYRYQPYVSSKIEKDLKLQWMASHQENHQRLLRDFTKHMMSDQSSYKNGISESKVINYFKSKGYDAMIDVEDAYTFDYPLILLRPSDSIVLDKKTRLT